MNTNRNTRSTCPAKMENLEGRCLMAVNTMALTEDTLYIRCDASNDNVRVVSLSTSKGAAVNVYHNGALLRSFPAIMTSIIISGGGGNDRLDCSAAGVKSYLFGGDGRDTLMGSNQADFLTGDSGEDSVFGNSGDDTIEDSDSARDWIDCGTGTDTVLLPWGVSPDSANQNNTILNVEDFGRIYLDG